MEKILASVIDAHGGLKRWKKFKKVLATIRSGGILFNLVNIPEDPTPRQVTTWLHEEHSSVRPVGHQTVLLTSPLTESLCEQRARS
jgi:hypothetical protein